MEIKILWTRISLLHYLSSHWRNCPKWTKPVNSTTKRQRQRRRWHI